MPTTEFNLTDNQRAERKLLVTCVNVGEPLSPEWYIMGRGVEDSSIEYNAEIDTKTDILGITETNVSKLSPQQDFEPFTIRGGSKLAEKLYDIYKRQAQSEYSLFEVLIIYGYAGTTGKYEAEKQTNCTIVPTSLGGDAYVDMPVEVHFSQESTWGTVNALKGEITFTPNGN